MVILKSKQVIGFLFMLNLAIYLGLFIHRPLASAAEINGFNICVDDYALCSAAICQAASGDPDHAICRCEGPFHGMNVGHSSCKVRTQVLTPTFSVQNQFVTPVQKPLYITRCTGEEGGRWADCLDAKCTTESGSVACRCPVKTSDFFFLGAHCADGAASLKSMCAQTRSGALIQHNNQQLISSFYGDSPEPVMCRR